MGDTPTPSHAHTPTLPAIVLAGGQSRRMGTPKAWLPFGDGTLLQHIAGLLAPLVSEVVVVAAAGQELPALDARRVDDAFPAAGPIGGLYTGLRAIRAPAALVTACDAPFLEPALLSLLARALAGHEIALAEWQGRRQPLPGVYAASLAGALEHRIRHGVLRLGALADAHRANVVSEEAVRAVDPEGASFLNANTPEEYAVALRRAGLRGNALPPVVEMPAMPSGREGTLNHLVAPPDGHPTD